VGTPRSVVELQAAVEHIAFELQQLADLPAAQVYAAEHLDRDTWEIACFESALLHARNLLDFLTRTARPDDMSARDFLGSEWYPPKSEELAMLKGLRERINKQLSHITWTRVDAPHANNLSPHVIACAVVRVFSDFVAALQRYRSEQATWFEGPLGLALQTLGLQWPSTVSSPDPGSPLQAHVPQMQHAATRLVATTSSAGTAVKVFCCPRVGAPLEQMD
jgi:hypothetical protein